MSKRANPYNNARTPARKRQKTAAPRQVNLALLQRKVNQLSRNVEIKQSEFAVTANPVLLAAGCWGMVFSLSDIAQGTGESERIGSTITVIGIEYTISVKNTPTDFQPIKARTIIFNDKQHSGSANVAASGPYGSITSPLEEMVSGDDDVSIMQRKWDMMSRYTFYQDYKHPIMNFNYALLTTPATGTVTQNGWMAQSKKFSVKIPNVKVHYSSAGGANSDVSTNMFQIATYAKQDGLTAPEWSATGRIMYTD